MVEAILYDTLKGNSVRCRVCQRRCTIREGERGHCQTRENHKGKLISKTFGVVSSLMISPIEKKPVYHFYPGSEWLSLGSFGCNFRCPGCQNWDIAHSTVQEEIKTARLISPQELIRIALKNRCFGISWTYNEPTNYVTNGFITVEALDMIGPYLDVFRTDLKGFSHDSYQKIAHIDDFSGILEVILRAKNKWKMHVEIVTNIIPGYNDDESDLKRMAAWISKDLGEDTPWHVTRFFPHLQLSHIPPTPVKKLEKIRKIGLEQGLKYVYLGNVFGGEGENTFCPNCGKTVIVRNRLQTRDLHLVEGKCQFCNTSIAGRF